MPGSAKEEERAGMIRRELEAQLGAENVAVEDFTVAPWGCLGSLPTSATLMLVAAALNISAPHFTGIASGCAAIGGLVFAVLSPLVYLLEFILGLELVDGWFEQKQSSNVIGTLRSPGTNEARKLLMVSAHHDSAPENTWLAEHPAVVVSASPLSGVRLASGT